MSVVATSSGAVRGFEEEGASVFLGIPFAAPPFGAHRFQAPAPPDPWDGVLDTVAYQGTAPQPERSFTLIPEPIIEGTNCLNVNVFTPSVTGSLPVLVWIHGGGFTAGCNASPWYRGLRFARDGVVVVSIGYRLGAEGFLPIEGAPSNRAVLDWVAALHWVQDNIAAFGGDPSKVTIGGQSAGGAACATLVGLPAAAGLFRSAICMSGTRLPLVSLDEASASATTIASTLGVAPTLDGLRAISPDELVEAQEKLAADTQAFRLLFGPIADGVVVDAEPAWPTGMPLMLGATAEEFNLALAMSGLDQEQFDRRVAKMGADAAAIAAYRAAYPSLSDSVLMGQVLTDAVFKGPALDMAANWPGPAYLYDFEWRSPTLGAVHCLDVPFAFDVLDDPGVAAVAGDAAPQALADAVHQAWVRFIVDGAPGWQAYDTEQRPTMVYDTECGVVSDPWKLARSVWSSDR